MPSDVHSLSGAPDRFTGGLRELAPGTYAWLQPNGGWGEANAGLVVGSGQSLLIDTLWDEHLAGQMLHAMQPLLERAPLRTVLNTHQDGDHWWGNGAIPAGAEIITGMTSRRAMDGESTPRELARLTSLARAGSSLPGSIGALSRLVVAMLGPFDFRDLTLRWPDRAFQEPRLELDVGGRSCELIVLGPAHTPGDTIVHVPDAGVVFAADLLFVGAIPVMWHGPSTGWVAALERILELDATIFVPGHGDVGDRFAVESMLRFFAWLRAEVPALRGLGGARAITAALIASEGFREWSGWECPERLLITVTALLREFDDRPPMRVTPPVRARLLRQVALLERDLGERR